MRLIDADALNKALHGILIEFVKHPTFLRSDIEEGIDRGISAAMQAINDAPTINATIRKPRESRRKLPCMCGCKHIGIWMGATTYQCKCDDCDREGPVTNTEIGAIRAWNDMIKEEIKNAVD